MMDHVKNFEDDKKLILNVGGWRHEVMASTIEFGPDTRLHWITQKEGQSPFYDPLTNEFFFDRNPLLFPYILNYYRAGKLHCPPNVCGAQFAEELQYWAIDETFIDTCCWDNYRKHKDATLKIKCFDSSNHSDISFLDAEHRKPHGLNEVEGQDISTRFQRGQKYLRRLKLLLWILFEDPISSRVAQVYTFISIVFIAISVTTFCLESMEYFRQPFAKGVLFIIESVCVTWFCCELLLRFVCSPDRKNFLKNWLNWIDLCAIAPFIISLGLNDNVKTITTLRTISLIRIFRVLKLTRHSLGLQILGHTLKASIRELLMLIFFLSISVVIFSSLIYHVEKDEPKTQFTSIPSAFWWSIVTMTTIGYGDYVPVTIAGKCIGTLCALCGVLVVSLPVPIVVSNFSMYYSQYQSSLRSGYKMEKEDSGISFVRNLHPFLGGQLMGMGSRASLVSVASRNSFCISPFPAATPSQLSPSYSVRHFHAGNNRLWLPQQSISSSPLRSATHTMCRQLPPLPVETPARSFSLNKDELCEEGATNQFDVQRMSTTKVNIQCDVFEDEIETKNNRITAKEHLTIKVHPPSCSDGEIDDVQPSPKTYKKKEITAFDFPDTCGGENAFIMVATPTTESVHLTPMSGFSLYDQSGQSPTTSDYGTGLTTTTSFATTPDSQITPITQFPRMGRRNAVFSAGVLASRWRRKCFEKRQKVDKQADSSNLTETLMEVSTRLKSYLKEEMKKTETSTDNFRLSPLNSSSLHVRRKAKNVFSSISSASGSSFDDDSVETNKENNKSPNEINPNGARSRLRRTSKHSLSISNNSIKPLTSPPVSPKYVLDRPPRIFQFGANEDSC